MDFAASAFQIKTLDDAGHIEGLAAGFDDVDNGGDKILRGAFTKTLADRQGAPLPMLRDHDMKRAIGAWTEWKETDAGLYVKGSIAVGTRDGGEAHALARMGALPGISVGYIGSHAARMNGGVRELPEMKLFEASLVAVPMHDRARVMSVKSIVGARDIEDMLRAGGLSNRQAKTAASAAWKSMNENEDDAEVAAILNASAARIAAIGGKR